MEGGRPREKERTERESRRTKEKKRKKTKRFSPLHRRRENRGRGRHCHRRHRLRLRCHQQSPASPPVQVNTSPLFQCFHFFPRHAGRALCTSLQAKEKLGVSPAHGFWAGLAQPTDMGRVRPSSNFF